MIQKKKRTHSCWMHVILVALLLFLPSSRLFGAIRINVDKLIGGTERFSDDLENVSQRLRHLQEKFKRIPEVKEIILGGGTVPSLLDHAYFGKPLVMRDLDIYVIMDRKPDAKIASEISAILEDEKLGQVSQIGRPSVRANPALPEPERNQYVAGYTTIYKREMDLDLEVKLVAHREDMELSGLLSFDTIRIVLPDDKDLASFVRTDLAKKPYLELVKSGRILDQFGGYSDWVNRRLQVVHWDEVARDPLMQSMRLARSFGKAKLSQADPEILEKMRQLNAETKVFRPEKMVGSLRRLTSDSDSAAEMKMVQEMGAFEKINPYLARVLSSTILPELRQIFKRADRSGLDRSKARMTALYNLMTEGEKAGMASLMPSFRQTLGDVIYLPTSLEAHQLVQAMSHSSELSFLRSYALAIGLDRGASSNSNLLSLGLTDSTNTALSVNGASVSKAVTLGGIHSSYKEFLTRLLAATGDKASVTIGSQTFTVKLPPRDRGTNVLSFGILGTNQDLALPKPDFENYASLLRQGVAVAESHPEFDLPKVLWTHLYGLGQVRERPLADSLSEFFLQRRIFWVAHDGRSVGVNWNDAKIAADPELRKVWQSLSALRRYAKRNPDFRISLSPNNIRVEYTDTYKTKIKRICWAGLDADPVDAVDFTMADDLVSFVKLARKQMESFIEDHTTEVEQLTFAEVQASADYVLGVNVKGEPLRVAGLTPELQRDLHGWIADALHEKGAQPFNAIYYGSRVMPRTEVVKRDPRGDMPVEDDGVVKNSVRMKGITSVSDLEMYVFIQEPPTRTKEELRALNKLVRDRIFEKFRAFPVQVRVLQGPSNLSREEQMLAIEEFVKKEKPGISRVYPDQYMSAADVQSSLAGELSSLPGREPDIVSRLLEGRGESISEALAESVVFQILGIHPDLSQIQGFAVNGKKIPKPRSVADFPTYLENVLQEIDSHPGTVQLTIGQRTLNILSPALGEGGKGKVFRVLTTGEVIKIPKGNFTSIMRLLQEREIAPSFEVFANKNHFATSKNLDFDRFGLWAIKEEVQGTTLAELLLKYQDDPAQLEKLLAQMRPYIEHLLQVNRENPSDQIDIVPQNLIIKLRNGSSVQVENVVLVDIGKNSPASVKKHNFTSIDFAGYIRMAWEEVHDTLSKGFMKSPAPSSKLKCEALFAKAG